MPVIQSAEHDLDPVLALVAARAGINEGQQDVLMRAATARLGHLEPSADDGFVNLDHAAARAEIRVAIIAHGFADSVGHEPSDIRGHAQSAMQLLAADALLAGTHQMDRLQPKVHGNVAGLEDGTDLDGEGLAAAAAFVGADAVDLPPILLMRSVSPQCCHTRPFGQTRFNLCRVGFFVVKFGAAAG